MSAVGIYVVSVHKLFAYRVVSTVSTDMVSSHTKYCKIASQDSRMHCKVQMNEWPLILWRFNCISTKEWDETRPSHLCLKSTIEDFRPDFTSKLVPELAFGTPKFYIAPYDKIKHELVKLSSNCDVKSGLSVGF